MTSSHPQGSQENLKRLSQILKLVHKRTTSVNPNTIHSNSIISPSSSNTDTDLKIKENAIRVTKLLFVGSILTTSRPKSGGALDITKRNISSSSSSSSSSSTLIPEKVRNNDKNNIDSSTQVKLKHKVSIENPRDSNNNTTKIKSKLLSMFQNYNKLEDQLLGSLESFTSIVDNFIFMSSIFKLNTKFKTLGRMLRVLSQVWVFITIINLKNLIIRVLKVNKIIQMVEFQILSMINQNKASLISFTYDLEMKLLVLKNEKFKIILELIGNLNELLMFLVEIYSIKLPSFINNSINLMSWGMSMYRVSKDSNEDNELENDLGESSSDEVKKPGFTIDEIIEEYSI